MLSTLLNKLCRDAHIHTHTRARAHAPVSYTHLDVYKRQLLVGVSEISPSPDLMNLHLISSIVTEKEAHLSVPQHIIIKFPKSVENRPHNHEQISQKKTYADHNLID